MRFKRETPAQTLFAIQAVMAYTTLDAWYYSIRNPHVCQIGCTSLERLDGPLGEFFNRELYRTVQLPIREQRLRSNEKQFQGGLVFKVQRLLYHPTLSRE
jgi:hypothetical protein